MKLIFRLLLTLLTWQAFYCHGQELMKVELLEDNILLFDAKVQEHRVGSSIDAYLIHDRVLIAIEPLFDGLKLQYQITDKQLKIWKDNEEVVYDLSELAYQNNNTSTPLEQPLGVWGDDGYYQFIELTLIEKIFDVKVQFDLSTQIININTGEGAGYYQKKVTSIDQHKGYLFPIEKLAILEDQRRKDRYNSQRSLQNNKLPITIKDQYRLFTPPHGRVAFAADLNEKKFNGSVQLVSDLLYHSSSLTMSKSDGRDLAANLTFSRFKQSPDDYILGLFDSYSFGDVSGIANSLTTSTSSGVGVVFQRRPENFRRKNLEITLDEIAPPNWDAELFHNQRFILKNEVPDDGRLIYENLELFYGVNIFEIKLYGPYGEEEIIKKTINVKQNPLAEGQLAYSFNALDKNHRLINDKNNNKDFEINNYGSSINYGVTERWQIGASFASIDNDQQLFSLKNNLSFNNFLFENDLAINQDGDFAQLTTITGSLFEGDNYSFRFESADNFKSDTIDSFNNDFASYTLAYAFPTRIVYTRFSANYYKDSFSERRNLTNILSKNINGISLSHTLSYNEFDNEYPNSPLSSTNSLQGSFGVSGRISDFYLSGFINYDPEQSDPILKSSAIALKTKISDPFKNNHYIQARYFPLNDNGAQWQLRHNVAWRRDDFQFTFASGYQSNDDWDVQFGIQFFLGYDYHHNKFIMDKELSSGSATLDVHTYLDRQANGEPDVLDYDLPDVTFSGNQRWKNFRSGKDGRTILPGVHSNTEFAFSAKWQEGSATLNNDYVVYTHPGAYVDVNMPFFLITDLAGFVIRQQQGEDLALRNIPVQLLNNKNELIKLVETDADGYFEFLQLMPDDYKVAISTEYLAQKGLTGEVIGTNIATAGRGGFVELPAFVLRRKGDDSDIDEQAYTTFITDEDNVDALVWSKDEELNKNYFALPSKGRVKAKYSLTQDVPENVTQTEKNTLDVESSQDGAQQNNTENSSDGEVDEVMVERSVKSTLFGVSNVLSKLEKAKTKTILPQLNIRQVAPSKLSVLKYNDPETEKQSNSSTVEGNNERKSEAIATELAKWVIQFEANKLPINVSGARNKYSAIGELFVGEKKSGKNETLYCLVSLAFSSKKEALAALKDAGLNGWITQSSDYTYINSIN